MKYLHAPLPPVKALALGVFALCFGAATPALALTEAEAQAAYAKAAAAYNPPAAVEETAENAENPENADNRAALPPRIEANAPPTKEEALGQGGVDVVLLPHQDDPFYYAGTFADETKLERMRMVVSMEDVRLKDAMERIVEQIAAKTGPWEVKWRLKPDHAQVLQERVNLTAESSFGEFIALLSDRVKNMSGVQLFVTVFDAARIIIISDTYY